MDDNDQLREMQMMKAWKMDGVMLLGQRYPHLPHKMKTFYFMSRLIEWTQGLLDKAKTSQIGLCSEIFGTEDNSGDLHPGQEFPKHFLYPYVTFNWLQIS